MEKLCRSVRTLYLLPRTGHINLKLSAAVSSSCNGIFHQTQSSLVLRSLHHQTARRFNNLQGFANIAQARGLNTSQSVAPPLDEVLEREIADECAELNSSLTTDQFTGFSVETDGADVKLTREVGDTLVTVRFTVSSSLTDWPCDSPQPGSQQQAEEEPNTQLVSMPEFQVQITKGSHTLEVSCFFEEMERDEESGEPYNTDATFHIDELVLYEGEPKETEFAVSAEYLQEDFNSAMMQYLAKHGIHDDFARELVRFATDYEKKQYVSLLKRMKAFVSQ